MKTLPWDSIRQLAERHVTLPTKTGKPFQVVAATDNTVTVQVQSGKKHDLHRVTLEKAVALLAAGGALDGPMQYRAKVADERPAYAWAILRHLGFVR